METVDKFQKGDMGDWSIEKDTEDMKIFYKLDQESGQMIVYAEKVVRADILNLIAVVAEAELMSDFVPNMISSKIVLE